VLIDEDYRKGLVVNPDSTDNCIPKKRLVIDVNRAGLGDRIMAVFSSIMLAVLTNRVLEINWKANKYCNASYADLFSPKDQESLVMKPLIFDQRPQKYDSVRNEYVCHLRLDPTKWDHFYALKDKKLFDKINSFCDVIFLVTNQFFTDLLLDSDRFGADADRVRTSYRSPYHYFSSIALAPNERIKAKATKFIADNLASHKWISVHAMGYYDRTARGITKVSF